MTQNSTYPRTLAIAPSTRGFGFAVLEGQDTLVNWGGRPAEGKNKNAQSLAKAKELITRYQPEVIVLQNTSAKTSRRSERVKKLTQQIMKMAEAHKVSVKLFSDEQVKRALLSDGGGTKHELAEVIAQRFPEDLGSQLPPKRRPWESEHPRIAIFYAVALTLIPRLKKAKRKMRTDS